jgi:uncharacterized protein
MQILQSGVSWTYTTVLNIVALAVSAVLVWRFLRTGGPDMLRMMGSKGKSAGRRPRASSPSGLGVSIPVRVETAKKNVVFN